MFPVGHSSTIESIVYSEDGKLILTAGRDMTAKIWDASTQKELCILQEKAAVRRAIFNRTGNLICTLSGADINIWETFSGKKNRN